MCIHRVVQQPPQSKRTFSPSPAKNPHIALLSVPLYQLPKPLHLNNHKAVCFYIFACELSIFGYITDCLFRFWLCVDVLTLLAYPEGGSIGSQYRPAGEKNIQGEAAKYTQTLPDKHNCMRPSVGLSITLTWGTGKADKVKEEKQILSGLHFF